MISFNHQVFLEVAQQLSFTKASEVLFITQPAISRHIRNLEEHYRCRFFERNGKTILLTKAGEVLYEHLLTANTLSKQIAFDIGAHYKEDHLSGELKFGASTTVALYILPSILSAFRKQNDEVKISLLNRNAENVLKALLNHEIDLGIIEGNNNMMTVNSQPFISDEVIPVCSADSYLAEKLTYTLKELVNIPVAIRERGSGTLVALSNALKKNGMDISELNTCMRLGGTEALKNFILADDCLGFLPQKSVAKELEKGELIRLNIKSLFITRQFFFIQRHGDENSGINSQFIKFAKSYYNFKL